MSRHGLVRLNGFANCRGYASKRIRWNIYPAQSQGGSLVIFQTQTRMQFKSAMAGKKSIFQASICRLSKTVKSDHGI